MTPDRRTSYNTILRVTSFSINYYRTHKSQVKYNIKHDLYKMVQKYNLYKSEKPKIWTFEVFSESKHLGFFEEIFQP